MEKKEVKWGKWFALGLGGLIGLSHIGMIGSLSNRQSKLPSINLPVGPYTSYEAEVGHNGYKISYKANDPKVMRVERDSNCLLYTSPSPRDRQKSRMPSSA